MNDSADPVTVALTALLPALLIAAAVLALPVSLALLARYRRAVQRSMNVPALEQGSGVDWTQRTGADPMTGVGRGHGDERPSVSPSIVSGTMLRRSLRGPWRLAAVYAAAGMAYAFVMAGALSAANPAAAGVLRFVVLTWIYAWPVVLSVYFVAAQRGRERAAIALGYAVVLGLLGFFGMEQRGEWWTLYVAWAAYNALPTLLLLAFLHRRIRAVGPLVFAFLVLALLGLATILGSFGTLGASDGGQSFVADIALALDLGAWELVIGSALLGFALCSVIGWLAIRWIRGRYEQKRASDQSILLDALWILFAAAHSAFLAFEHPAWILAGVAAFLAYKAMARAGYVATGEGTSAGANAPRLLLLRVFSLGRRSEHLFDLLTLHWRHIGSVRLIAGPDLATTTVEPHELLDYLTGKLARRFVDGRQALEQRIAEMDVLPDLDGRYRVNEFFCRADTWKQVLARLVTDSDAVLMDLRGFSASNAGCRHEIEALIDQVPLPRVVLLTDPTTDTALLEEVIREGWLRMGPGSPNRSAMPEEICRLTVPATGATGRRPLLGALCAAARPMAPVRVPV